VRPLLIGLAVLLVVSSRAAAQPYLGDAGPHGGSLELGGGAVWIGGYDAGSRSALESPNSSSGAPPLTLFTTSSRVAPALGGEVRLGIYFGRRMSAEGTFQISRPALRTAIADDFENAAPLTAEEMVSSYVAGGSLLYHFGTGRLVPFALGGAGYVRQLHEGGGVVLTGTEIRAGGGVKYWIGQGAHRFGFRVDAHASFRSKSVGFEEKRRIVPVVAAGITYLF
jgi:hypothetical protein